MTIGMKSILGVAATISCVFALLFLPAGTLAYWQGWLFFGGFSAATAGITLYLYMAIPDLLERRLAGGPQAEGETSQKIVQAINSLAICLVFVVAGLDRRYGWSAVPPWLSVAGFALSMAAMAGITLVGRQNHYMAATVKVERGQTVVSTGFYARVRHPMYAVFSLFLIGAPPALASWWSLIPAGTVFGMLVIRLLCEERYLRENLEGYSEYCLKVRWRLFPGIF